KEPRDTRRMEPFDIPDLRRRGEERVPTGVDFEPKGFPLLKRAKLYGRYPGLGALPERSAPSVRPGRLMFLRLVLGEGLEPFRRLTIAAGGEHKTEYCK